MEAYFPSLLLLSVGAFIEARCSTPALRPEDPAAERAFRILGRSAFGMWLAMLAWGMWQLAWWQPAAGLVGSLAANALALQWGARPYWPGASMGMCLAGLFAASWVLTRG